MDFSLFLKLVNIIDLSKNNGSQITQNLSVNNGKKSRNTNFRKISNQNFFLSGTTTAFTGTKIILSEEQNTFLTIFCFLLTMGFMAGCIGGFIYCHFRTIKSYKYLLISKLLKLENCLHFLRQKNWTKFFRSP